VRQVAAWAAVGLEEEETTPRKTPQRSPRSIERKTPIGGVPAVRESYKVTNTPKKQRRRSTTRERIPARPATLAPHTGGRSPRGHQPMPPPIPKGGHRPAHWRKPGPRAWIHDGLTPQLRWYWKNQQRVLARLRAMPANPQPPRSKTQEAQIHALTQTFGKAFRVCGPSRLDRPALKYLDAKGALRVEFELSAHELIRQWKAQQKKKKKAERRK